LDNQIDLLKSQIARYDPIIVTPDGVVYDGAHGVKAGIETSSLVNVNVVDFAISPGPPIGSLPVVPGRKP